MKKQGSLILLILTLVFGSFSLGFFVGRNYTHSPVQVSALPPATAAATAPTTEATLPIAAVSETVQTESIPETADPQPVPETTVAQPIPEPIDAQPVPETTVAQPIPEPTVHTGLIDINTADAQTLMLLPGIGEVLSQRIVDYRTEHGAFTSPEELILVKGIGEKRLEALLPFVTVGG